MLDRKWVYGVLGIAALAVIGGAGALYLAMSLHANPRPPAAAPSIEAAAEKLAQRLRANDGSGEDWALLARSYVQMRRFPEAVDAFGKALQKMPGDQALIDEQAAARKAAGVK